MSGMISIIIPAYNAEKTIERLIRSVLDASDDDLHFEMIVVNDGSKDHTLEICERLQKQDNRLKVLTIENSGPGEARKCGLKAAKGDYVYFADSDDEIVMAGLKKLIAIADSGKYDIICGNLWKLSGDKKIAAQTGIDSGEIVHDLQNFRYRNFRTGSLFGYTPGKLYRLTFLKEHDLWPDDHRVYYMEDSLFNLRAFVHQPSYYFANEFTYLYYQYEDSVSHTKDVEIVQRCCATIHKYGSYCKEQHKLEENLDLLIPLIMRMFSWAVFQHNALDTPAHLKESRWAVKAFMNEPVFKELVEERAYGSYLKTLPSKAQCLAFGFFFRQLNRGRTNFTAFLFWALHPLLKIVLENMPVR